MNRTQAGAFLKSLSPSGEYCTLHNHTRTYFEALLGSVPLTIDGYKAERALCREMADLLRQIAAHLDDEPNAPNF